VLDRYDPVSGKWDFESPTRGDFIFPASFVIIIIAVLLSVGGLLAALFGYL